MEGNAQILVRNVPQALRDALIADARERDLSLNEVAVQIVADSTGIIYRPPDEPRPFREVVADAGVTVLNLDVPEQMRTALKIMVAPTRNSMQGVVLSALCRHYGLPEPSPARRQTHPSVAS